MFPSSNKIKLITLEKEVQALKDQITVLSVDVVAAKTNYAAIAVMYTELQQNITEMLNKMSDIQVRVQHKYPTEAEMREQAQCTQASENVSKLQTDFDEWHGPTEEHLSIQEIVGS